MLTLNPPSRLLTEQTTFRFTRGSTLNSPSRLLTKQTTFRFTRGSIKKNNKNINKYTKSRSTFLILNQNSTSFHHLAIEMLSLVAEYLNPQSYSNFSIALANDVRASSFRSNDKLICKIVLYRRLSQSAVHDYWNNLLILTKNHPICVRFQNNLYLLKNWIQQLNVIKKERNTNVMLRDLEKCIPTLENIYESVFNHGTVHVDAIHEDFCDHTSIPEAHENTVILSVAGRRTDRVLFVVNESVRLYKHSLL